MSKCQKDVKMSKRSQMSKSQTHRLCRRFTKKINSHNEVHTLTSILTSNVKVTKIVQKHFLCTFWGFLVTIICDVKIDVNMCEPHYVNLFFLWTSSIVHVFDFLTFDIFLTTCFFLRTWHLFDNLTFFFWHMGNGKCGQMGITVNTENRDEAPWGMGHMGDGAHRQWGTWVIGHMIITSLILHGSLQKFYCT